MRPRVNKIVDSKAQIKQLMEETAWLKKQLVWGDGFDAQCHRAFP